MRLYDMLEPAMYYQQFSVYINNAADQNLLIGRGTRAEMLNEKEHGACVFDHLMDKVEFWCMNKASDRVLVFIRDDHFDEYVEERFSTSDDWGKGPEERPWRFSSETERETDKYIRIVYA